MTILVTVRPALLGLTLLAALILPAHADPVDLAKAPLYTTTSSSVKPNLMFILDNSGSMNDDYMPDEADGSSTYGYRSAQCNGVAYNPAITYSVPVDASGNAKTAPSFTAACANGFSGSCSADLTNSYYYKYVGSQPALSYQYTTSGVVTGSTFYRECKIAANSSPTATLLVSGTSYTSVSGITVNGVQIMSSATTASNASGTVATRIATSINNKVDGYSATVSGSTVTLTGPAGAASHTPVVTKSGSMTITPTAFAFVKVTVSSTSGPNGSDERQNYANWYSFYRTRLMMMKSAVGLAFKNINTDFRVGFSTISYSGTNKDDAGFLPINDFVTDEGDATHKSNFYSKLYGASGSSWTPLRAALVKAGRIYAGRIGTDPMQYSCQQNFTLLSTDGYWNTNDESSSYGPFGLDGSTPVGQQDHSAARPMYDGSTGYSNTLADIAMYYYQTDLRYPDKCSSGSGTGANLCPTDSSGAYSPNVPGNNEDNNVKPHMTTFTLGLGVNGVLNYSSNYAKETSGDFYSIRTGGKDWPNPKTTTTSPYANTSSSVIERIDDLWHAAVNGRGTYFSAKSPDTLVSSLKAALSGMSTRLGYGTSAATSNLAPILGDNSLFVASFTTAQWTGNLVAESIDPSTGEINATAAWCAESVAADTGNNIPACTGTLASQVAATSDSRTIWFNKNGTLTNFAYDNLPAAQQAYFDTSKLSQYDGTFSASDKTAATGATLVNFLRGQTQHESQTGATANLYRDRKATLGDIVDTPPLYLGKPTFAYNDLGYNTWKNDTARQSRGATVFVGANDGMLHAFNATTGTERWAFVPTPVMPDLHWLADLTYTTNHHNYVDGRVTYFDVCVKDCGDAAKADWRTLLIGGLGGGGRGYFALDVTDPTAPTLLWEFTSLNDADLGYSFGNPLAVKKADGTWVVLLTSGYDNVKLSSASPDPYGPYDADGSGRGYLFVLNPLTGAVLDKIEATDGANIVGDKTTPSGLGKIAAWADTPTLDVTVSYVYGGDLQGNFWRFNINTRAVVRLATFTDASANPQPITTRPELAKVNGHRVVYVATGKYLEKADLLPENFKTQSLYAIADTGVNVPSPRTSMVQQTLTDAKPNRTVTTKPVTISPPTVNGWFVDLPDSGELANIDMTLAQGTLLVPTNVPTNGVCEAGGYSWYNFFNYKTGSFVPGATTAARWAGNDLTTGHNVIWIKGKPVVVRTGSGTSPKLLPGVPFNPGGTTGVIGHRVSWREIIRK